ncbi:MAG: triple tyrosine motif-containing protein [Saprospiraceae bacterium]|nr:triple tyrosine motif-containing protein [Saprospiraceae bacterium]
MITLFGLLFLHLSIIQNTNYYIYTDSDNLTWISSTEGIHCYYGENIKVYDQSNTNILGKNIQSYIYEDESTNLWFSTHVGLNQYNRTKDNIIGKQFFWKNKKLKTDYRVYGISNGVLWFSAEEYLFKYDISNNQVIDSTQIKLSKSRLGYVFNKKNKAYLFVGIEDKTLAISFDEDLNSQKCDTFSIPFSRMCMVQHDIFLASNGNGIFKFDELSNQFIFDSRFGYDTKYITSNNKITLISDSSKILICRGLNNCRKLNSNLPNTELYIDNNNTIWYSNDSKDLQYESLAKKKFKNIGYYRGNQIPVSSILKFNNRLWISSRYGGIYTFDSLYNVESTYNTQNRKVNDNYILGLFVWNENLCASSTTDILVYNKQLDKFIPSNLDIKFNLQSHKTIYDNILISDPESKKIYRINNQEKFKLNQINDFIDKEEYRLTFSEDNQGEIYISVNKKFLQVLEYDTSKKIYLEKRKLDIPGIRDLYQINSDSIFIGNSFGLYLYLPNDSSRIFKLEGPGKLLNTTIYSIEEHKRFLWLGTAKGLIKYSIDNKTSHKFTLADGIQDLEYNSRSSFKDKNGNMFFGGVKGLTFFHPDSTSYLDLIPTVYLSTILINDTNYPNKNSNQINSLELPFSDNTISFTFNSLDFSDPVNTRVKYQLENYDKNWIISKSNLGQVRYPNLPPGLYKLKILASNSDGVWGKTPREIQITIHPPWYATWWARSLAILLLGGTVYLTIRSYYKRQIREKELELREANLQIAKQKALSEERTRIAGEMHDDLGGGLTTIRFLSQKALRNTKDQSQKNLIQKISTHSEALVNNMSEIIWAMNSKFDSLNSLISFCRRYAHEYLDDHEISLNFMVSGNTKGVQISGSQRRNIFLALKEALHNVVKHAKATEVKITFVNNENLQIQIADNGIGLKNSNEFGNGTSNMTKRIKHIGGHLDIHSNNGTTIAIVLPINSS